MYVAHFQCFHSTYDGEDMYLFIFILFTDI